MSVIERLSKSSGGVIGFKVAGEVSVEDAGGAERQIEFLIHSRGKRPIGILMDLSGMTGIGVKARWEEIRFLQKYTNNIARMAVVGAHPWEKVSSMFVVAAALLQAETLYFNEGEIGQAWHWVHTSKHAMEPPPPQISAPEGLWKDYVPEYMGI